LFRRFIGGSVTGQELYLVRQSHLEQPLPLCAVSN